MATWKKVVVSGSNISELNNDSAYLTTVDISADTNLAGGTNITLSGDTLNLDADISLTSVTASVQGNVVGNVTGDVTGDVTGNVTGDVTGNLTGNVTGDVTGNLTGNVTGDLTGTASFATRAGIANSVVGDSIVNASIADGAIGEEHFSAGAALAITGAFGADSASIATRLDSLEGSDFTYNLSIGADSGADDVVADGSTINFVGGTNLNSAVANDQITFNLDSNVSLTSVTASVQGDVVGNVTGNLTGNVTGNVTGNLTGTADTASYVAGANVDGNISGKAATAGTADTASYVASSAIDGDIALGSGTSGNYVATVAAGTGISSTGASTGEGIAHSLSVDYGTSATTALRGDTEVDNVSVDNLKTALAAGFGSNAVTIGDADDVVTIGNNLVITGDLTVNGDNLVANVTNLAVDDRYILLNSGSAAGDSGIVFGGSLGTANSGMALILDDSDDRLVVRSNAFDPDSNSDATLNTTNHYFVAGAFSGSAANATTAGADKLGNIRVEGDIYIYA